jgi:hypothetical protein
MTLEEAIERSSIILPEHKKEFNALLARFPRDIERWLYGIPDDANSIFQGDVLVEIPLCFVDEDGDIVKGTDSVAMISNSCDMQPSRKETVIASPIISLAEYEEHLRNAGETGLDNKLTDVRHNKIFSFFYLPQSKSFSESFIDFSRMVTINSSYINRIFSGKRMLSLSRYGFYLFLIKLTFHLARMEYPPSQN